MDTETRVIAAMREFAEKYKEAGKCKKYDRCMKFIAEFEESYFG